MVLEKEWRLIVAEGFFSVVAPKEGRELVSRMKLEEEAKKNAPTKTPLNQKRNYRA